MLTLVAPVTISQEIIFNGKPGIKLVYLIKYRDQNGTFIGFYKVIVHGVFGLKKYELKYNISIDYSAPNNTFSLQGFITDRFSIQNYIPVVIRVNNESYSVSLATPIPGIQKVNLYTIQSSKATLPITNTTILKRYKPIETIPYICRAIKGITSYMGLSGTIIIDIDLGVLVLLNLTGTTRSLYVKLVDLVGVKLSYEEPGSSDNEATMSPVIPLAILIVVALAALVVILHKLKKIYIEMLGE